MEYLITIVGHVKEREYSKSFPYETIRQVIQQPVENKLQLVNAVQHYTQQIIEMGGMLVRVDPYAVIDVKKLDTERMWVPLLMLSHLTAEIALITGDIPTVGEGGSLVNIDGKEVTKQ